MSATSPAPWEVTSNGGAMTIVARDRSVVAIVMGNGSASPFESSNAALMAAAPALRDTLRDLVHDIEEGAHVPALATRIAWARVALKQAGAL